MGSAFVKDVTAATFESDVMARSQQVVVVVDFWAPWCGPCQTLGPVLEAAIGQFPGQVELAKVNCDQEPELAQAFGVSGIPAVKAVRGGQVIHEFVGAQPAHVVEAWVRSLVPTAEENVIAIARREVAEGNRAGAIERLRGFLAQKPDDLPVVLELGRQLAFAGRNPEALATLAQIPEGALEWEQARQDRLLIDMMAAGDALGGLAGALRAIGDRPEDPEARFALAGARWQGADPQGAIDELLVLVRRHRAHREDGARRALLAIFDHLGAEHPAVSDGRSRLANLLFA